MARWRKFGEDEPERKTPVLVYRPGYFKYLYNVCIYDGVSQWQIARFDINLWLFRARPGDYWIYVDEVVPIPVMPER